jgi:hypothetical protein
MAFFSGKVLNEDGSVCCDAARVSLEVTERDGATEWYGTISAPNGIAMVAGQKYRLVLSDGRSGQCVVRRNTTATPEQRAISFRGLGPLA